MGSLTSIRPVGAVPKPTARKRAKKRAKTPESIIEEQVEGLLDNMGLKYIRVPDSIYAAIFGNNMVKPYIKAMISAFIKGLPDITVLLRDGRYICIELKTEAGKLSQGQKTFAKAIGEDNYHVCRSVDSVVELLKKYSVL
jgi:hypothetical protein